MQTDSIKHKTCLDTRDQNFTRSLYFSIGKTDQNVSQGDVILSAWDLNVSHCSVQVMQLPHRRRHSLEQLGNKLYKKSLCHGSFEKLQIYPFQNDYI